MLAFFKIFGNLVINVNVRRVAHLRTIGMVGSFHVIPMVSSAPMASSIGRNNALVMSSLGGTLYLLCDANSYHGLMIAWVPFVFLTASGLRPLF